MVLEKMKVNHELCGISRVPESLPPLGFRTKRDVDNSDKPNMMVINGIDADPDMYPWQVSLQLKGEANHFCGGSMISECHVLTAAHCFSKDDNFEMKPKEVRVVYGSNTNIITKNGTAKMAEVKRLIKHSQFVDVKYDIGIIQLTKSLKLGHDVQTVCIPIQNTCAFSGLGTLTGYGLTNEEHRQSTKVLKAGRVRIVPKMDCERELKTSYFDPSSMICQANSTTGACYGDSGGPMISRTSEGRAIQRGITSWVLGSCGSGRTPSTVYTDVCAYNSWILKVLAAYPC
jgi:secreted trypsin-like serine protease